MTVEILIPGLVLGVAGALLVYQARAHLVFGLLLVLSVLQVFGGPFGAVGLSAFFAAALLSLVRVGRGVPKPIRVVSGTLLALLVARTVALGWSPVPSVGYEALVEVLSLVALLVVGAQAFEDSRERAWRAIDLMLVVGSIGAACAVLFRVFPGLESTYLQSSGARWLLNNGALEALFGANPNNILDLDKSGGPLFLNANVAAVYFGAMMCLALTRRGLDRQRRYMVLALVFAGGVVATGSKAGLFFLMAAIGALFISTLWAVPERRPMAVVTGILLTPVAVWAAIESQNLSDGLYGEASDTLAIRVEIWFVAAEAIAQNPILGLGYGGWSEWFGARAWSAGVPPYFPPHNSLIYEWIEAGIAGFVCSVLTVIAISATILRSHAPASSRAPALVGVCWVAIQSLGENFNVFGESHILATVGALVVSAAVGLPAVVHDRTDEKQRVVSNDKR